MCPAAKRNRSASSCLGGGMKHGDPPTTPSPCPGGSALRLPPPHSARDPRREPPRGSPAPRLSPAPKNPPSSGGSFTPKSAWAARGTCGARQFLASTIFRGVFVGLSPASPLTLPHPLQPVAAALPPMLSAPLCSAPLRSTSRMMGTNLLQIDPIFSAPRVRLREGPHMGCSNA